MGLHPRFTTRIYAVISSEHRCFTAQKYSPYGSKYLPRKCFGYDLDI